MLRNLITLFVAFLCCLFAGAQPMIRTTPVRGNHHTHRLPGVNERRLARLEKMREANNNLRHRQGPWRINAQPQTKKGLVLLVEFSDTKMKDDAAIQWNNRFNQLGYSLDEHVGSVRDYFVDQSYGLLTIDFDIVGPLELTQTQEYYGSRPNSHLDDRAAEMVIEALKLANTQVNYADYDWDGDSWVEQVYVIYAGTTQYNTQGYIWPHEWSLSSAQYYGNGSGYQYMDGVYVDTYAVSNELASETTLEGIGTACHEFSHCLGFPDFYDTEYNGGTAAQNWDVLDGGSYNGPRNLGEHPSPYTAYERWSAGWIDLIPLTEPCRVKDMPAINEEGVAYIINNSGSANEYFILENRQNITFGRGNRGHGLMVWHIDYNRDAWNYNKVNADKSHQRMTFLPADGQVGELVNKDGYYQYQISSDDEAGDPYPGRQNINAVQQLTWFTSERYGTKNHQNLIHDISETSAGKINFTYGEYYPLRTPDVAYPTDITANSFTANWLPVEGAATYTLEVEAITNDPSPSSVLSEDFSGFANVGIGSQVSSSVIGAYTKKPGWTGVGIYGTMDAFVCISSQSIVGKIMTPAIEFCGETLMVEFDAAYYGTDGSSVVVSVLKDEQVLATETVPLTAERQTYTLTFDDIPSGCNVRFESTERMKRFYLYNVNISDMSGMGSLTTSYKGLTSTSYVVEPIVAEMCYYRVQAECDDGTSEWSEWMDVDIASFISELSGNGVQKGQFYDLSGRLLRLAPRQGLYIQGGKLYMKR